MAKRKWPFYDMLPGDTVTYTDPEEGERAKRMCYQCSVPGRHFSVTTYRDDGAVKILCVAQSRFRKWPFKGMAVGEVHTFPLGTSFQAVRTACYSYAKRSGRKFTTRQIGRNTLIQVERLPDPYDLRHRKLVKELVG